MTAQLAPLGVQKFFDNNGNPLANGFVYTYAAGTNTPQATYVDSTQTTQNTNPIQLNARGEAPIWLDPTLGYKINITDQFGNQIPNWPVDNIPGGFGALPISTNLIPNPTNTFTLGNSTHSWAQLYLGPNADPVYNTASDTIGYIGRTAAEIAAGVTPANFAYVPGHVYRYGTNTTPGTTDMTAAINTAATVCRQGNYTLLLPADACLVSSSLNFSGIHVQGPVDYPLFSIRASSAQFNVITSTGASLFEDFGVDGGNLNGATAGLTGDTFSLVGSPTCYGITFRNVRAWNNKNRGVYWQTAGYSRVERLDVFGSQSHGIEIFGPNLGNASTTVSIYGNTRSSLSVAGYGLKITEAVEICCIGMIMENNAHGILLAGNDNRNLTFRNVYQEVIGDNIFLDGGTSFGVGLTIADCYDPAATVVNLTNWTNVYAPNNVFSQRPQIPFSDRIVQNDGGAATTSTTGGVNVTAAQITLNPGIWMINAAVQTLQSSATGMVQSACQITTSVGASGLNNSPNNGVFTLGADQQNFTPNGGSMDHRLTCFTLVQITVATTFYLRAFFNFSGAGALAYHGFMNAVLIE
jgi:hypothetical protein